MERKYRKLETGNRIISIHAVNEHGTISVFPHSGSITCYEHDVTASTTEATKSEFEAAYLESQQKIQLKYMNLVGQTENEFINNVVRNFEGD